MATKSAYIFNEQLGRGGFGEVYEATRKSNGQKVAIKIMNVRDTYDDEILMLKGVNHRNIISYYNHFCEENGKLCIVMELCEGGNLQDRIDRQKKCHKGILISLTKIHPWFKQTVAAIQYLHSSDIIHRNIKPANILIKKNGTLAGEVRVADFGIARDVAEMNAAAYLEARTFYMSPEMGCGLKMLRDDKRPSIQDVAKSEFVASDVTQWHRNPPTGQEYVHSDSTDDDYSVYDYDPYDSDAY